MTPLINSIARRKLGTPNDWEVFRVEWIGDQILCEGGIPRVITRGPKKGRKRWDKCETRRVIISRNEIEAEKKSNNGSC